MIVVMLCEKCLSLSLLRATLLSLYRLCGHHVWLLVVMGVAAGVAVGVTIHDDVGGGRGGRRRGGGGGGGALHDGQQGGRGGGGGGGDAWTAVQVHSD